jgi:hypothetical protein
MAELVKCSGTFSDRFLTNDAIEAISRTTTHISMS